MKNKSKLKDGPEDHGVLFPLNIDSALETFFIYNFADLTIPFVHEM